MNEGALPRIEEKLHLNNTIRDARGLAYSLGQIWLSDKPNSLLDARNQFKQSLSQDEIDSLKKLASIL